METFGDRLRHLRMEKNLHQVELGSLLDLSASAIGSYERNLREPSYAHLAAMADLFSVSVDYLLCRTDERLTVQDYTRKDSHPLSEILASYTVTMDDVELTTEDKNRILDIAYTLIRLQERS